jgi:hypothetical protein
MKNLFGCIYWTYLFKSTKENRNRNTNETNQINPYSKKNYARPNILGILFKKNIFYFEK